MRHNGALAAIERISDERWDEIQVQMEGWDGYRVRLPCMLNELYEEVKRIRERETRSRQRAQARARAREETL